MARRRVKKRTHIGVKGTAPAPGNAAKTSSDRSPKSMVIRIGASEVGPSITQLVKDVRSMMEPETATRLKERRSNKLRDYTTMAGPLGVTHLLLFSRSKAGNTNLRLAVTPRGPTLHFRVESYSLSKDVHRSQKRPRSGAAGKEFLSPPLLVMNNFASPQAPQETNGTENDKEVPKHLESLTTTVFQSLFPAINPTATPLQNIKRVLLLDRSTSTSSSDDSPDYTLTLRHYAIETRTAKSVPKPLRRLDAAEKLPHAGQKRKRGGLPNLGKLDDIADYILDPHAADGFTSGSESEPETDAEVEVLAPSTQKPPKNPRRQQKSDANGNSQSKRETNGETRVEKKGIKLHEIGPRLRLRLTKVEEGLCDGKVMWHSYVEKSAEEIKEMERLHEQRRLERQRRKEEQRANVERKKAEKKAHGGTVDEEDAVDEDMENDDDDFWEDEFDGDVDAEAEPGAEVDEVIEDAEDTDGEDENELG